MGCPKHRFQVLENLSMYRTSGSRLFYFSCIMMKVPLNFQKKIIKYAIKTEQSHVQFQFPIPNSSFGYLILVITSRHPSDVFYWAGERSIPCLANHEEEAEPSSISTTPQRNNSTHNKSVWKTASTPDTGRYIQTCFKKLGGYNKCITRYLVRVCVCAVY